MAKPNPPELLLRSRVAVDRARLTRLATQNAIQRSRIFLAETRALLVSFRFAVRDRELRSPVIEGPAAVEANRLLKELRKIRDENHLRHDRLVKLAQPPMTLLFAAFFTHEQ